MSSNGRQDETPTWVDIVGPRRAVALQEALAGPLLLDGVGLLGVDFFIFLPFYDTRTTGETVLSGPLFGLNPTVVVVTLGTVGAVAVAAGYVILFGGGHARETLDDP